MMTILAMVNAEKEGQIESKLIKARQMEEIREAKRKEAEARHEQKRAKLEEVKKSVKRNRKRQSDGDATNDAHPPDRKPYAKKRVSFG
jgi:60S ribosomal subunit assembly/export protein LOC1